MSESGGEVRSDHHTSTRRTWLAAAGATGLGALDRGAEAGGSTRPIDYVYRFDPTRPNAKPLPRTAAEAQEALSEGNRKFARWMERCRGGEQAPGGPQVVECNTLEVGRVPQGGKPWWPLAEPFAAVLGCSDSRVPTEMIFGQGFNDLFDIRVAGNVLADECLGSVSYALHKLESVRVVVVLGHRDCGAVTAAVDAYLAPRDHYWKYYWPRPHPLGSLLERVMAAVLEAADALRRTWGDAAPGQPGYREALIEAAVYLNAARVAQDLRRGVAQDPAGSKVAVGFGVFDLSTYCVQGHPPPYPDAPSPLAPPPDRPEELSALATRIAQRLRPSS
jgi:carbonic anhydrase